MAKNIRNGNTTDGKDVGYKFMTVAEKQWDVVEPLLMFCSVKRAITQKVAKNASLPRTPLSPPSEYDKNMSNGSTSQWSRALA